MKIPEPILITGGAGFIAKNLCDRWRSLGLDVDAPSREEFDVRNRAQVEERFQKRRYATVVNTAAYGSHADQAEGSQIFETNVLGLIHLLQASEKVTTQAFVDLGSSSEYGLNSCRPSENADCIPNSLYSVSKISASQLCHFFRDRVPVIHLRLYAVYGPGERSDRLMPTLVRLGFQKQLPRLVDPDISRDFIYVEDVLSAIESAVGAAKRYTGNAYNIGTGLKTTIREVAQLSCEEFKLSVTPDWGSMPNRLWDLKDWVADPSAAQRELKWKSQTSLRDGFRKMMTWWSSQRV